MSRRLQRLELQGPAGRLEALHTVPPGDVQGAALVCHPHPQYGGTMHTKAVYRSARALWDAGYEVLRFNFRGVGRSDGSYDEGRGEQDDARAALDWLQRRASARRVILAGFSFGSYVAMRLAEERHDIHARIALGVPLDLFDFGFMRPGGTPLLLLAGEADDFCPPDELRRLGARLGSEARVHIVPGAGHLLLEAMPQLQAAVEEFARDIARTSPS